MALNPKAGIDIVPQIKGMSEFVASQVQGAYGYRPRGHDLR